MNNNLDTIIQKLLDKLDRLNIISLGDSHALFYKNLNKIQAEWIGPALAYNINQDKSTNNTKNKIFNILNNADPDKTAFILTFGEIDIRVHVVKRVTIENISLEESVIRVAEKYIEMIEYIVGQGYKVLINGIHTTASIYNPQVPCNGSTEERNTATLIFNSYLEKYCDSKYIPFMSLSDLVIDSETLKTNEEYIKDGCHLNLDPELQEIAFFRFLSKLEKFSNN